MTTFPRSCPSGIACFKHQDRDENIYSLVLASWNGGDIKKKSRASPNKLYFVLAFELN